MVADDVKPAKEKTPANHDAEPVVENETGAGQIPFVRQEPTPKRQASANARREG
jgi:hypothetical protein